MSSHDKWFKTITIHIRELSFLDKIKVDLFHRFTCRSCLETLKDGKELICQEKGQLVSFICNPCEIAYDIIHVE